MQSCIVYKIIFLLIPGVLFAHGVNYTIFTNGIGIEAIYSDGEPMSFCETKIYSPESSEEVFQQGLTDFNGRFIFLPDQEGIWKIEINDGMGHGINEKISVSKNLQPNIKRSKHLFLFQKIISGLGILGLFYTTLFIILYRRRKNAHT